LFGLNAGLLGLFVIEDSKTNGNSNYNQDITTPVVNFRPGFHLGAYISFINSKRFSLQYALNVNFLSQRFVYQCFSENRWGTKIYTNADYTVYYSNLMFSLMPKLKLGKQRKFYIGIGGFLEDPLFHNVDGLIVSRGQSVRIINLYDSIWPVLVYEPYFKIKRNNEIEVKFNNTFGLFLSSGVSVPVRQSSVDLELRVYVRRSRSNVIDYCHPVCALNVAYQLKPGKSKSRLPGVP
jgi:hypothetical protein